MHIASNCFDFFMGRLEVLMAAADRQKNPALYLYQNNARTPLFMLEGLSKMHLAIHNRKKFTKLKEQFKLLEDAIGAIDYYDAIAKGLSGNKKIPLKIHQYLQAQTREKIQRLNELLTEKKWIDHDNERIKKIRKKLDEADWLANEKETGALFNFYQKAIDEILDFTHSSGYHFDNMEEDVHELRRKLRWLSIYPQALKGVVQLADNTKKDKKLLKYLTSSIINSPYNKMPDAGNIDNFLLLDRNYFFALSWMIDALGKLKDEGLQIVALREALQQTENLQEKDADKKVYQFLGRSQTKLPLLLQQAASISETYFREKNLEQLVLGIGSKK